MEDERRGRRASVLWEAQKMEDERNELLRLSSVVSHSLIVSANTDCCCDSHVHLVLFWVSTDKTTIVSNPYSGEPRSNEDRMSPRLERERERVTSVLWEAQKYEGV